MKTIKVKKFEVPVCAMGDVTEIITDNELENTITGVDEDGDFVYVAVRYEKGKKRNRQPFTNQLAAKGFLSRFKEQWMEKEETGPPNKTQEKNFRFVVI